MSEPTTSPTRQMVGSLIVALLIVVAVVTIVSARLPAASATFPEVVERREEQADTREERSEDAAEAREEQAEDAD